jgi:hypothetical protein
MSKSSRQLLEKALIAETFASWIGRGILKAPQRAAEKADACYGGDVSRVVDVCRQRFVFADVRGVADCLALIASARPCVRVLRVKDSMRAGHNPRLTAGFRAVVLNMRIDTDETRALGVERHVCEVLLTTTAWADAGGSIGERLARHDAYLAFRTARAMMGREYSEWHVSREWDSPASPHGERLVPTSELGSVYRARVPRGLPAPAWLDGVSGLRPAPGRVPGRPLGQPGRGEPHAGRAVGGRRPCERLLFRDRRGPGGA